MKAQTRIAYRRPTSRPDVELRLDANEGPLPGADLRALVSGIDPEVLRRYPDATTLEATIATWLDVSPDRILVTAGADDGIDRCCRMALSGGGNLIMPRPGFEMFNRYAALAGGTVREVDWTSGTLPVEAFESAIDEDTRAIAVISPNNPTGLTATRAQVEALAQRAADALIIVDRAYAEFEDENLDCVTDQLPNVVTLRSFSKAWGLAGLRVGYVVGPTGLIARLRASGPPYAVSAVSLALASVALESSEEAMREHVERIRRERVALAEELAMLGAEPTPSQANFVLARVPDSIRVWEDLQALGIAVRQWTEQPALEGQLRIGCPGNPEEFLRLTRALRTALRPEAILFDMDGVLADEGPSYREAIVLTAQSFGVGVDRQDVRALKAQGGANNDWELTRRILLDAGVERELQEVVARFEEFYQGTDERRGLCERETCLVDPALLERIASGYRLGIVTGRPRKDAERFLRRFQLDRFFECIVTLEDAPAKPDPAPVRKALSQMRVRSAWMIGDTPDDARAARTAAVLPIGILPPSEADAVPETELIDAGCSRVIDRLEELEELLP